MTDAINFEVGFNEIETLTAKVAELEKELKNTKDSLKWRADEANRLNKEVEDLNMLIDTLPNAPSRRTPCDKDEEGKDIKWTSDTRSVMVRLSGWLAIRK
jgi:regulator of replication initiation timing